MDDATIPADALGRALSRAALNLLVRDVGAEVVFASEALGLSARRVSANFALLRDGAMARW